LNKEDSKKGGRALNYLMKHTGGGAVVGNKQHVGGKMSRFWGHTPGKSKLTRNTKNVVSRCPEKKWRKRKKKYWVI